MRSRGFTLIEIVVVVAILAIVSAIAVPNLIKQREDSNLEADAMSLFSLNDATESYARVHSIDMKVVFDEDYDSEQERLDTLINTGFLLVQPDVQSENSKFVWNETKNEWNLNKSNEVISLGVATAIPTAVPTQAPTASPTPVYTLTPSPTQAPTPVPTVVPTATPAATQVPNYPEWYWRDRYYTGNRVIYKGHVYQARRAMSMYKWKYPTTARYWQFIS